MKPSQNGLNRVHQAITGFRHCAALVLLMSGSAVLAQSVIAPPPVMPVTPPAVMQAQTNQPGEALLAPPPPTGVPESPFRWGPVTLHPHAMYRFIYGNGIDRENTIIHEIMPGVLFDIGRHISLDYTPTLRFYSSDHFRDTVDHNVILSAGGVYEDLSWRVFQGYSLISTPLVETGVQTDQETFTTALGGSYQLNTKVSLDIGLNQNISSAESAAQNFASYKEWSTLDWLNYRLYERITISLGAGFGYLDYDEGSDMTYEQLQGRVIWRATEKIGLQAHAGAEDRQFLDSNADDLINPVFGAGIEYRPFDYTTLSANADRAVTPSYFNRQISETMTVSGNLSQRLIEKVYLNLNGGYTKRTYVATTTADTGRDDDYYFFGARATVHVIKRGTVSIFYYYSDNSSNADAYSFSSNQIGFELGYSY